METNTQTGAALPASPGSAEWHERHKHCYRCGKPIGNDAYFRNNQSAKVYHAGCNAAIMEACGDYRRHEGEPQTRIPPNK